MIIGITEAAQDISFPAMAERQQAVVNIVQQDPAVGLGRLLYRAGRTDCTLNNGRMFIALKPQSERQRECRSGNRPAAPEAGQAQGITLYMQAAQDITIGARLSRTQYQYTLIDAGPRRAQPLGPGCSWTSLKTIPEIADVASDQQNAGPLLDITVNRDAASSYGILPATIDNTLDDAFGQRIVSTMSPS